MLLADSIISTAKRFREMKKLQFLKAGDYMKTITRAKYLDIHIINVNLLSKTKELYLHKLVDHLFSNRKSPNFANTQIQQGADPLPSCLPVLILLPAIIIAATTTGKQPATPSVNGRPRK